MPRRRRATAAGPSDRGAWVASAVLTALAVAGAWTLAGQRAERIELLTYPEIAGADPALVREFQRSLGNADDAWALGELVDLPQGGSFFTEAAVTVGSDPLETEEKRKDRVRVRLARDPAGSGAALLQALIARHAKPDGFTLSGPAFDDGRREWEACWLRDNATPETDAVLVRIAANQNVDTDMRQKAVVALSRPRQDAARERLIDIACDDSADIGFREYVLMRLPRLGGKLPERLRDVIYLPFRELGDLAAAALAASGDLEAPTLLVERLRRKKRVGSDGPDWFCAEALRASIDDDPVLEGRLAEVARLMADPNLPHLPEKEQAAADVLYAEVADDVIAWLEADPRRLDTEFESGRRAYLASDRRQRQFAHNSFDAVLAMHDDELDLAAAILEPGRFGESAGTRLDQLDRLAVLVRRDAGRNPEPSSWIASLNRRLLSRKHSLRHPAEPNELGYVMSVGSGFPTGYAALYLAVAERLRLPLHGVEVPGRVFVRWDDGTLRRNIDMLEGGAEHPDAWYASAKRSVCAIREEDVRSGAYLSNLSKRRFLALYLVHSSAFFLGAGYPSIALERAEQALALDPESATALMNRASVAATGKLGSSERAFADVTASLTRRGLTPDENRIAVFVALQANQPEDALRRAEAVLTADPANTNVAVLRARALVRLGRLDEATRAVERLVDLHPLPSDVTRTDIELRIAKGSDSWEDRLDSAVDDPLVTPDLHLDLAEGLIDGTALGRVALDEADRVLRRVAALADESPSERRARLKGTKWTPGSKAHLEPSRRYLRLRRRCSIAMGDEQGAAAAEARLRELDAVK